LKQNQTTLETKPNNASHYFKANLG